VHVVESPNTALPWRLTPEHYRAAAKRFPALRRRIMTTFGDYTAAHERDFADAEVVFAGDLTLAGVGERAPRMRWLHSTSAGIEELVPLIPRGVVLTNNSGVHPSKGGEYVMTALLLLNHRFPHFVTCQRQARWDPEWSTTIAGKTVVVLGTGAIGSAAARLARRFGMRVLGVSRSAQQRPFFERVYPARSLRMLLSRADFLVVAAPLTRETHGLVGRTELDRLPRHAGLVNVGRGAVVDNHALAEKLRKGELSGAVLDVFPVEPLPAESALWSTPNLILSPHCGVDDATAFMEHTLDLFLRNVMRYLEGKRLLNIVDLNRGY
jgi:phosphoglycerate dehydrogenase-like enzyme